MTSIPEWVEFTFRTSDGQLYWGSKDGYTLPEEEHKSGWAESSYRRWKASAHAQIVIHQLEND